MFKKSLPFVLIVKNGKYEDDVMEEVMQREAGGCNCSTVNQH